MEISNWLEISGNGSDWPIGSDQSCNPNASRTIRITIVTMVTMVHIKWTICSRTIRVRKRIIRVKYKVEAEGLKTQFFFF